MRKTVTLQKKSSRKYNGKTYYKYTVNIPEKMIDASTFRGNSKIILISDKNTITIKHIPKKQ